MKSKAQALVEYFLLMGVMTCLIVIGFASQRLKDKAKDSLADYRDAKIAQIGNASFK